MAESIDQRGPFLKAERKEGGEEERILNDLRIQDAAIFYYLKGTFHLSRVILAVRHPNGEIESKYDIKEETLWKLKNEGWIKSIGRINPKESPTNYSLMGSAAFVLTDKGKAQASE